MLVPISVQSKPLLPKFAIIICYDTRCCVVEKIGVREAVADW